MPATVYLHKVSYSYSDMSCGAAHFSRLQAACDIYFEVESYGPAIPHLWPSLKLQPHTLHCKLVR